MRTSVLPKKLSGKKAPAEPKDVHSDGEQSLAFTPEAGDDPASRDDKKDEDQEAASIYSAQHGDSAPLPPKRKSGSIGFEKEQECEDQEIVRLKSSLIIDDCNLEGSIVIEDLETLVDKEKESLKSVLPNDSEASVVFEDENQDGEDQEKVRQKTSLSDDSDLEGSIVFAEDEACKNQKGSLQDYESDMESSDEDTFLNSSLILPPSNGDDKREKENNMDTQEGDSSDQDDSEMSAEEVKDDSRIWKLRLFCGKVVNNEYVQIAIICLIMMNAVIMGIATFDFVTEDPHIDNIFEKMDRAFLVVFTIEVAMQLFYLGFILFTDGWLTFDFLIVVLSWSFESLQVVRAFRIFRAFRLFTRIKPLRDLVLAIGAVMPRMYAIGALLLLIFYIFSVLFTELFKDLPLSENYFGTLDASLFTCMELMTLEWGSIVREVMVYRSWAWAPFVAFIALTGFIVFNLIVAVVCDAVAVTEKTVRELDGIESDNPYTKIDEAQERIDLLQCHIEDMLRTQLAVQDMIEIMAGELLHLEVERVRSDTREVELRIQLERRKDFEKSMQTTLQLEGLQRTTNEEKDRRAQRRESRWDSHHGLNRTANEETDRRAQRRESNVELCSSLHSSLGRSERRAQRRESNVELSSSHHGLPRTTNAEKDRRAQRRESNVELSSSQDSRQALGGSDRSLGTRSRNARFTTSETSLGAQRRESNVELSISHHSRRSSGRSDRSNGTRSRNSRFTSSETSFGAQRRESNVELSSSHHSRRSSGRSDRSLETRSRNSRFTSSDRSLGAKSRMYNKSGDDSSKSILSDD